MKILNVLIESVISNVTTEIPFYDNLLKKSNDKEMKDYFKYEKGIVWDVVEMSPIDYIEDVAKAKGTTYAQLYTNRKSETIEKYAKLMKNGTTFPMPVLDYSNNGNLSQEGLHRSFAAELAGVRKMPVIVVKSSGH